MWTPIPAPRIHHMPVLLRSALGTLLTAVIASLAAAGTPRSTGAQQLRVGSDPTASADSNANSWAGSPAPSPYGIRVIVPDSIDLAPLTSMSELLQARVPGLSVQRISGASGSASRIRLRGTRSEAFSSTPLVIVDGLRMEVAATHWPDFLGPGPTLDTEWSSRLDDLDPEDVERVEVLGGPAAASRFGRGAASGVILITTKRGSPDGLRWAAHSTFGTVVQATDFPASFDQRGIDRSSGEHIDHCSVIEQAYHSCEPIIDSLLHSNALELHSPFRTGARSQLGLSGSAGNQVTSIYLAGNFTREGGTLDFNNLRRNHILVNGKIRPFSSLEVGARAGYTRSSLSGIAPGSDWDILLSGLAGGPDGVQGGYLTSPDSIRTLVAQRSSAHFIVGGTATWRPIRWLSIAGALGADRNGWVNDQMPPVRFEDATLHRRTKLSSRATTARVDATASWPIGSALRLGTTIGIERFEQREEGRTTVKAIDEPSSLELSFNRFRTHGRLNSTFGRLDLAWNNRVSLTSGLRHDKIWHGYDAATYPSVGIAWQISNEPWFPRDGAVGMLRLHANYGKIGQSRIPLGVAEVYLMRTPESSETETGLDAGVFGGRATLALTYYRGKSDFGYDGFPFPGFYYPPLPGFSRSVHNSGVEAALSTTIVDERELSVTLDATAAFPRTRFEGLPGSLGGLSFAPQQLAPGYPVASYWAPPILGFRDEDADGRIGTVGCTENQFPSAPTCEVRLGATTYLGSSIPTREFSFRPRVIRRRITLSALLDYSGGHKLFNQTEFFRCNYFEVCRASQEADAPLGDQARVAAAMLGSPAGYIEDASYWKLRELSLGIDAPDRWAARLGAKRLSVTLAARNLATWTRYGGPDPEVNSEGYESLLSIDSFTQPAVRYFIMRLDIGW